MGHTAYIPVNDNIYRIHTQCHGRAPTFIIIDDDEGINEEETVKSALQSGSHDDPIIIDEEGLGRKSNIG